MAEQSTEQPKQQQKPTPAKQIDFQVGGIGHQSAAGAGAGAPLDSPAVTRIQRNSQQAPRSDLLALQRAVGNRAVAALVRGATTEVAIQAKLEVGPANDVYEREADQIARTVTSGLVEPKPAINAKPKDERDAPSDELKPGAAAGGPIQAKLQVGPVNDVYERQADHIARLVTSGITQRKPAANVKSRDDRDEGSNDVQPGPATTIKRMVQRKEAANAVRADGSFTADTGVHERLQRLEQSGRPLPDRVRQEMEPRFGADFGGVRIHTGSDAVQLSRDIGARAFTHGSHIAFGSGGFSPNSQAGRHLLAHELTHTIQQTGASPLASVQRRPTGVIQRGPTWEKIKGFFNRSKQEPEPVLDPSVNIPAGTSQEIQKLALSKAQGAWEAANSIISTAESGVNAKLASRTNVDAEMGGMEKTGKLDSVKNSSKQMKGGDQAAKTFLEKYKTDLKGLRDKIQTNLSRIVQGNELIADERMLSGNDEDRAARGQLSPRDKRKMAMQNYARAIEAEKLLAQVKEQSTSMGNVGEKADVEEASARAGIDKGARSLPSAEKSVSDSVLDLLAIRGKVQGYYSYLEMDFKVLEGHLMEKGASVTKDYGESASLRAMGSGTARGDSEGTSGALDEAQAFELGGGSSYSDIYSQTPQLPGQEAPVHNQDELAERREAEMAAGQNFGENMVKKAQEASGSAKGKKPEKVAKDKPAKLNKPDKEFAQQVKRLEIRAMLMAKAKKRMPLAKVYLEQTERYYTNANLMYETVNRMRAVSEGKGKPPPDPAQIELAVVKAGDARAKVALAAVNLERMRKFKQEVYEESQKYKDDVGPRATNKWTRKAKKLVASTAGVGLKVLTGGLYRVDAQEEAGGYQVNFKGVSLWDDIKAKNLELMQIQKGLDGKHVRGLGGRSGAEAYAFFKGVSFALQIVRDIASACALWVTIVTAGVGAPVGAIFASLALFATMAKAAIDLMLVIWSGTALANTNDPQSRMILRGENMRHGLALGEGLVAGAGAGVVMGVSGNTGLLNFQQQTGVFGSSKLEGGSAQSDQFGAIKDSWSQGGAGGEFTYGGMLRDASNAVVPGGTQILGNIGVNVAGANHRYATHTGLEKRKVDGQMNKLSKAKLSVRALSPAAEAFKKLGELAAGKKLLRKAATEMPAVAKNIQELVVKVHDVSPDSEEEQGESQSGGPSEQASQR